MTFFALGGFLVLEEIEKEQRELDDEENVVSGSEYSPVQGEELSAKEDHKTDESFDAKICSLASRQSDQAEKKNFAGISNSVPVNDIQRFKTQLSVSERKYNRPLRAQDSLRYHRLNTEQ